MSIGLARHTDQDEPIELPAREIEKASELQELLDFANSRFGAWVEDCVLFHEWSVEEREDCIYVKELKQEFESKDELRTYWAHQVKEWADKVLMEDI